MFNSNTTFNCLIYNILSLKVIYNKFNNLVQDKSFIVKIYSDIKVLKCTWLE